MNLTEQTNERKTEQTNDRKPYTILLADDEVAWVRDYTKVDAVAPAVVAVVRKAREAHERGAM